MTRCDVHGCARPALVNVTGRAVPTRPPGWSWSVLLLQPERIVRVTLANGYQRRAGSVYLCHECATELDVPNHIIEGALAWQ